MHQNSKIDASPLFYAISKDFECLFLQSKRTHIMPISDFCRNYSLIYGLRISAHAE